MTTYLNFKNIIKLLTHFQFLKKEKDEYSSQNFISNEYHYFSNNLLQGVQKWYQIRI